MKKSITKSRIIGYILLLTMVSLMVVSLSFARYSTQVSGMATASVAAWGADYTTSEQVSNTIDISGLVPGGTQDYKFRIINEKDGKISEVAQSYSITVDTTGNLPLEFVLSLDPASTVQGKTLVNSSAPAALTFTNNKSVMEGGELPPAISSSHDYILTISWPEGQNGAVYSGEIDLVTLTVKAQQILPDRTK